jgi:hypothetical protein
VQDYHNWELLIVGDHCPVLDAYMEQQKQAVLGGWTGRRGGMVWLPLLLLLQRLGSRAATAATAAKVRHFVGPRTTKVRQASTHPPGLPHKPHLLLLLLLLQMVGMLCATTTCTNMEAQGSMHL